MTLTTPTVRNMRTLIWLQRQKSVYSSKWDAVVTSLERYHYWDDQNARIVGMILLQLEGNIDDFMADLYAVSKDVTMILLPQSILSLKTQDFWSDNFDNVLNLDQLLESYPYLLQSWNGTAEDAISLMALLYRYNRLVDCPVSESRKAMLGSSFIVEQGILPQETWLITQYFQHPDKERAKEIRECLVKNCACPYLDRIVLLNEKNLSKEWKKIPGSEKITQVIIKRRLTYANFLQFVHDQVPNNVYTILCNADIYMGSSLSVLWRMDLKERMLALLRWDDSADGEEPVLFGPRADSQDTWILLSDSIKSQSWPYATFDFPLGQPGCDNAFAGHMLRNRISLSNPALTFQTFHLHNSNVRNYTKKDMIISDLYINLVPTYLIDTKQEQVPKEKVQAMCNELVTFEVKSSSISNEITYCTMLEKEGRYKWEPTVENHYFEPAIPVYRWKNACVTPNGLVYDPYTIYVGKHVEEDRFNYWKNATVDIFTPLQSAKKMLAIPFPDTTPFRTRSHYVLQYIARACRLLQDHPDASFWVVKGMEEYLRQIGCGTLPAIYFDENTACWAEEVVGLLPCPAALELGREDVSMLRSMLRCFQSKPENKICTVILSKTMTYQWIEESLTPYLLKKDPEWIIHMVSENDAVHYDEIVGSALCLVDGDSWPLLWAAPPGCCILEFQQELELQGECQHLCHVADLNSWVLMLSKGSIIDVQEQIMLQLEKWYKKNFIEILI